MPPLNTVVPIPAQSHIFFSPHLDDVVLSCGGLIYQLVQQGKTVMVFTVMAGPVPPDLTLSSFVVEHFERWGLAPDPVLGRKAEDNQAVTLLGGTTRHGAVPDALYRTDGHGLALYTNRDALFAAIHPHDPTLSQAHKITRSIPPTAILYVPLGAGHHVDHQLVLKAVLDWQPQAGATVFLYEEFPYSADGTAIIQAARALLDRPTTPKLQYLSNAALRAKTQAIACYRSQISTFWDDVPAMAQGVQYYARQVGDGQYAERLWQMV